MKRQLMVTSLCVALVAGMGIETRADDRAELDAKVSTLNTVEVKHGSNDVVYARIAAETGVSAETLRKEKSDTGLGFGGLLIAHELAKASGKTFAEVVAEFKAGKGWGQIAAEANVKLGALVKTAHRVEAKVESEMRAMKKIAVREKEDLEKKVAAINASAKHGEAVVFARISSETSVAVETLRKQKEESGLGYGELFIATELSKASGKSFADVVAEFKAGKGWGEIAAESNLKVGKLVSSATKLNAEIERGHAKAGAQSGTQAGLNRASGTASGSVGAGAGVGKTAPRTPVVPNVPLVPRK